MESRESQRDKRVQDVINGRPSGGGDSPTASAMRAREEIQGIEAERSANLERQRIISATRQQQMATMKQAALLGASGMAAADGGAQQVSPLAQQAAAMNPQTQAILQKYGVKPGSRTTASTTQTSGPNIRTTNTTNNNVRNEIKIVQPQIPMRQQQIAVAGSQGKSGNLDKFKAWLDSSFAKQANEYEIQQKEYRKREWNLARNSNKLFQKLSESTKSLGEKMDPRNMGSTFGGQLKTLLFLFLATTINKWWNPLMKRIASFEAGFKAVFGIPVNADLERGGAEGLSFVNKIKEFIGIDTKTERGKATSLLGGIREVFSDGITRLIDTLKLFIEDRRIALQKINMPDFKMPDTNFDPLGKMINSAFKGVMAPATEYLGNILSALMGGSSAVARKASNNVISTAKDTFKHSYGGRYYTSESTDFMGNLKDDSTYGMSEMLTRNLATKDNVLRTGSLMTGLKMLEGNAQKSGGAVINPELLARLGIGPDVISKMVASGQAQYVPYKIIMVPKSEAEAADYSGGSWGSYVGREMLSDATVGVFGGTMTGKEGWGRKALRFATNIARLPGKALSTTPIVGTAAGTILNSPFATLEGSISYATANSGNSSVVAKAVPESDPRPGTPIRLLRITPAGFNTIKSQHGIKAFDPTDRNFRTWLEGQERNQKAIMGVRGKMVYENRAGMEALDKGQIMGAAYDARMDEIWNRDGAWKRTVDNTRRMTAGVTQWVGSKINVLASGVSGNPSYARRNTIHNLYQTLKAALDEKRRDLPKDKREAFARLMAAQAMHESAGNYPGGVSKLAYEANNYGGVIATKGRPVYYLNNGTISKWSKFNDMQDWANYQVGLLDSTRYKTFDADPSDYVSILKQGGYFGDGDEGAYAMAVQQHLGNVNSVVGSYQYTSFTPSAAMTAVTPPPTGAISLGADLSGNNIKGCSPESVKDAKLKNILRSRNTGKFYSTTRGWLLLGFDNYRSLCTAGPSTFYEAGGFNALRGSWWNTGSPYTATSTRIGGTGLRKIWNGSLGQIDSMGSGQLKPGDIGILFGKHKDGSPSAHGMMWDGNHWVSDTIQSKGACYDSGRLGNQSAQIWRMPEFWPDDFGGGDEKESGAETTYIDSNGEVYNGTFMGAAGNVAGQVIGSMGSAVTGMAQSLLNGKQVVSGYNPAALSASQKATIEWMKRNGAVEDESGLYIYDEATKTRSYLDPNSGISKTGNITRANIKSVAHMNDDGTIDSYETDTEAIDSYKDRAIGKLLNVQISEGKAPGSEIVDIYIGTVSDIGGFSDLAKKYLNYYRKGLMEYTLYEVTSDGSEMSSILIPRIPMLDDNGKPIKLSGSDSYGISDPGEIKENHYFDSVYTGNRRVGWTFLYKKRGFKYKKLASDISDTISDFHPYLHGELGIGLTPEATKRVNAILAYIRGELENPNEKLSWMNDGFGINKKDQEKLKKVHDTIMENGEKNLKATLEKLGITEDSVSKSIKDWESGKNKDNYITYINDKGEKEILDATLGIKIASGGLKSPLSALSLKDIMSQTGEDVTNNLRRVDALSGNMDISDPAVIQRYFENETKNLRDSDVRKEFLKRIAGKQRDQKINGDNWKVFVGPDGKLRYSLDTDLEQFRNIRAKYQDNIGEILGTTNEEKIRDLLVKGLSAETLNKLVGYKVGETKGPNLNDANSIRAYYHGFEDLDTDRLMRSSKSNVALKNSWLAEDSMSRSLANALVKKYNKNEGRDSEELFESNGILMYRDANGMVHAQGTVTEEEGMKSAKAFDNSERGASMYADVNEKLRRLNLGTQSGQALMEAEYATKYGAKSLGNGNMYIEKDGYRVVFNVNDVEDHASVKEILSKGTYYRNSRSGSDEKNQAADNTFGENSGWSRIVNEEGVELRGTNGLATGAHLGGDSDFWARDALGKHMTETEENISKDDKKKLEFQQNYQAAISNLQNERKSKIESGNVNEQLEGHAGNIEDYTKRSADYLEVIAGYAKKDAELAGSKDPELEKKYLDLKAQKLPLTQAEQRAMGPVKKEDVDAVTSEIKNSESAAISMYRNILLETTGANGGMSEKGIHDLAYSRLLRELPGNKYTARFANFGNWQRSLIEQGRPPKEAAAETKAKKANIEAEKANIEVKKKTQEVEAKVVKTQSETTKIQEATVKKTAEVVKQQERNAEEERKQLEKRAEMMSRTETHHQFDLMKGLAGNLGEQKVIYNQEGSNVTINVYNRSGFDPISYSK